MSPCQQTKGLIVEWKKFCEFNTLFDTVLEFYDLFWKLRYVLPDAFFQGRSCRKTMRLF